MCSFIAARHCAKVATHVTYTTMPFASIVQPQESPVTARMGGQHCPEHEAGRLDLHLGRTIFSSELAQLGREAETYNIGCGGTYGVSVHALKGCPL